MRRAAMAGWLAVLATAGPAAANGRPPATTSVELRAGDADSIYLGATFGLLISHDGGCSFRWVCEQSIGYGGTFDPHYAVAPDGTIYATTFEGLRVSRDGGCSFTTATAELPPGAPGRVADLWVDAIALGEPGEVWIATAESGQPNDVYYSSDGGHTFAPRGLASPTLWWKSVVVAPSRSERVYVTGYQVADEPPTTAQRSDDRGATWAPMPLDGVAFGSTPLVTVTAVDPADPDRLWLRSIGANPPGGDRLYVSTDAGAIWTEAVATTDPIRDVVVRATGELLVATIAGGSHVSTDGGLTFDVLDGAPQLACLAEDDAGALLGCGANWKPDFSALGRSADAATWSKVFRFSEMAGPLECPAGTPQHDTCAVELWPGIEQQFLPTAPACAGGPDAGIAPDASGGGGGGGGCCGAGGRPTSSVVLAALALLAVSARRARRRRPRASSGSAG
ncbi:MAG: sialidase family protein [Kofleriaceae bacterium]